MNDVSERVRKVLEASLPEGVITDNIDDDFPLIELGVGIDSVARLELLVALEQEFRVRLDEGEITLEFFESVGEMSRHISGKLGDDNCLAITGQFVRPLSFRYFSNEFMNSFLTRSLAFPMGSITVFS